MAESSEETEVAQAQAEVQMELAWESTEALVHGPELRAAVDLLASFDRIESARTGSGGTPSEVYAAYVAVVGLTGRASWESLLRHASPVVRGYMVQHLVREPSGSLEAMRPLLSDETEVEGQSGCILGTGTIASRLVEALCDAEPREAVLEMLEAAAAEARPEPLQARAVVCLARTVPERAVELAAPMLGSSDAVTRRYAVMAFTVSGLGEGVERLESLAEDTDRGVRAAAATAVARLGGRREVVERLLDDEDDYVRMIAASAYVGLPQVDTTVVVNLLADETPRVRSGTAQALAREGVLLHLLEPVLMAPRVDGRIMQEFAQRDDDELTPMMRRLVGADTAYVRERATEWIGRRGDDSDLPALRAQLVAPSIGERRRAAEALAARGDAASVSLLEEMLRSDGNPHGRIAAAEALAAIRGEAARPALEAAVAAESTWARATLQEVLRGLDASEDANGSGTE